MVITPASGLSSARSTLARSSLRAVPASFEVAKPRRVIWARLPVIGSRPRVTFRYHPPPLSLYTPSGFFGTGPPPGAALRTSWFS